ncbi:MAG: dTDP-4-dehydrorhamnose reductase [Candidatus Helarchaeota archaeon]|nr:dTDP-4-dehydrorhamnose reductase [Candidatus Helarchaeota archaeon]
MRIVIIGSNGQLGMELSSELENHELVLATHNDIEIKSRTSVFSFIKDSKPDVVINTAAFHKVEECEKKPVTAFRANALGAKYLALACLMVDAVLLHISTDYVFGGVKGSPYNEDDLPNPLNVYGMTKLAGEHFIKSILKRYFIVRTSGLYGKHKCRAKCGNFVDRMISLAEKKEKIRVVDDEFLTPTYTYDLSKQIKKLINTEFYGTYHITNSGFCSWYEFAENIFKLIGLEVNLERAKSKEFASKVKRPLYSVLENKKLKSLNMDFMPMWDDALKRFLKGKN